MDNIFLPELPSHERYGYGSLKVGDVITIKPKDETINRIRASIGSHAQHRNKRFKTRTKDGILYVKRIA